MANITPALRAPVGLAPKAPADLATVHTDSLSFSTPNRRRMDSLRGIQKELQGAHVISALEKISHLLAVRGAFVKVVEQACRTIIPLLVQALPKRMEGFKLSDVPGKNGKEIIRGRWRA